MTDFSGIHMSFDGTSHFFSSSESPILAALAWENRLLYQQRVPDHAQQGALTELSCLPRLLSLTAMGDRTIRADQCLSMRAEAAYKAIEDVLVSLQT